MAKVKTKKMNIWHWDLETMLEIQSAVQEQDDKEKILYFTVPLEKSDIASERELWRIKTNRRWSADSIEQSISRIYDCRRNDHNKLNLVLREELIMRDYPNEEGKE